MKTYGKPAILKQAWQHNARVVVARQTGWAPYALSGDKAKPQTVYAADARDGQIVITHQADNAEPRVHWSLALKDRKGEWLWVHSVSRPEASTVSTGGGVWQCVVGEKANSTQRRSLNLSFATLLQAARNGQELLEVDRDEK